MGASFRSPSPTCPASPGPTPVRLWQSPKQVLSAPWSPGPTWDLFDDPNDHFTDLELSEPEDNEVVAPKRRRTPSPEPAPRPSAKRRLEYPLGKPMGDVGGNHDGTTTSADACADAGNSVGPCA